MAARRIDAVPSLPGEQLHVAENTHYSTLTGCAGLGVSESGETSGPGLSRCVLLVVCYYWMGRPLVQLPYDRAAVGERTFYPAS
jgi:hypothetical protein